MPNLSVVNANNLDSRFATPAYVDTRIANQLGISTRTGAYSFGGADFQYNIPGSINIAVRYRFMLTQTPLRIRVRYRNFDGIKDGAAFTASGLKVGKTYIGAEQSGSVLTYAAAPQLVDATGTGSGSIAGLTEYVTPWFTPAANTLKPGTTLLLSHEVANPSSSEVPVAASDTSGGYYNLDHNAVNATGNSGYATLSAMPLELVLEYEYISDAKVGLFIGHSITDSFSSNKQGWWGQHTGFPQQWARRTGNVAVVNAYAYTSTFDWGSSSPKWDRFPTVAPSFIFASLIANDIFYGADATAAQAQYANFFSVVHAKYPGVPVYTCIEAPYGQTSGSIIDNARNAINTWLPGVTDSLNIAGIIDLDRPMRDETNHNLLANDYVSSGNFHPNVRGYNRIADIITTLH